MWEEGVEETICGWLVRKQEEDDGRSAPLSSSIAERACDGVNCCSGVRF